MKSARILTLVLVLCMVSVCFLSGTVAKYTSTGTGTDTASVAKWSFKSEGTDIATTDTFTFDLFKTVKDTAGDEADVDKKVADDHQIIAPGTSGSFVIDLANESEVTAKFGVVFNVTEANNTTGNTIPIQYRVKVGDTYVGGDTWTSAPTTVDIEETSAYDVILATAQAANGTGADKTTVTVEWKWVYEDGNDTNDTALGKDSVTGDPVQITVSATVTATQVD